MEWLNRTFTEMQIYGWEILIDDWFFVAAMAFFLFELIRYAKQKILSWNLIADSVANLITLAAMLTMNFFLGLFYLAVFYFIYDNYSMWQLEITPWTIAIAIVLADFIYYWEHRFMHRVGFAWATHTVHHSSPYFNISVAYRFGPLDSIIPLFFHLPLAALGFNPFLILFAEMLVQLYQTILHTETIGKGPRWFEGLFNTPSHHRVHHGSNPEYIDKNYAGIFIIWDRMFGTFEEERAAVVYGITTPIESVNPIKIFFHGITRLATNIVQTKGIRAKLGRLFLPPDWEPGKEHRPSPMKTANEQSGI